VKTSGDEFPLQGLPLAHALSHVRIWWENDCQSRRKDSYHLPSSVYNSRVVWSPHNLQPTTTYSLTLQNMAHTKQSRDWERDRTLSSLRTRKPRFWLCRSLKRSCRCRCLLQFPSLLTHFLSFARFNSPRGEKRAKKADPRGGPRDPIEHRWASWLEIADLPGSAAGCILSGLLCLLDRGRVVLTLDLRFQFPRGSKSCMVWGSTLDVNPLSRSQANLYLVYVEEPYLY
jgi:hypothetical protein